MGNWNYDALCIPGPIFLFDGGNSLDGWAWGWADIQAVTY